MTISTRTSSIGVLVVIQLLGLCVSSCQPVSEPPLADKDPRGFPSLTGDYLGTRDPRNGARPLCPRHRVDRASASAMWP